MTISQAASVNLWREAILDRLAVLCMDAPQDEPPASILRRIIAAEVEIALDPSVSDAVPHRTLLQQALDALSGLVLNPESHPLIAALREALAAARPEPYAHLVVIKTDAGPIKFFTAPSDPRGFPVYLAPPAAPASQWMPIETAPKDVTILLYGAKRLEMCVGMHHSRDGWVTDTTSEWMSMYPPTHWMPLPAAPDHLRDVAEKVAPAAAPAPAGWVMVPREPTPEMRKAAADAWIDCGSKLILNKAAAAIGAAIAASPAAPVVREPLRDDAFHAWVEEASADHPNLLERQEFRDAMYNAWINGYNTRVDEQAHGITEGKP